MMIADIIRKSETQSEIYFLLTSYLEALQFSGAGTGIPQPLLDLPLRGKTDMKARFEKLVIELDSASRRLDDEACLAIKEALHIFGAALNRLRTLDGRKQRLPVENAGMAQPDLGHRV
ncbi:MAG TPA: hypothetical protein VMT94_02525 [Burkholderiales bacterium]|nr:hypothetical protein [Burkholderiales bacterium]